MTEESGAVSAGAAAEEREEREQKRKTSKRASGGARQGRGEPGRHAWWLGDTAGGAPIPPGPLEVPGLSGSYAYQPFIHLYR
ncbi:hypothetical protein AAFF_G00273720 [Aldrovandia affinis]|uniref:Uncharacterized protein n=1 Tax=Aldrovandia affinis TaxID=143900 RepID=A0AAD7SRX5_9TELE|nr:hypothetical protein AAFF_G00273720 [Aldrovandia affinis]